jgi:hypothetical protein
VVIAQSGERITVSAALGFMFEAASKVKVKFQTPKFLYYFDAVSSWHFAATFVFRSPLKTATKMKQQI